MSQLPVLLGSVQEELDSSEWAVRKAAADALSCMATATGTALGSYRGGVLASLENSRFDKVIVLLFSQLLDKFDKVIVISRSFVLTRRVVLYYQYVLVVTSNYSICYSD